MTRSVRRVPITGISTADSDKVGKTGSSRALRRRVRQTLATTQDADALPAEDEIRAACTWPKDGKTWHGRASDDVRSRLMRK